MRKYNKAHLNNTLVPYWQEIEGIYENYKGRGLRKGQNASIFTF